MSEEKKTVVDELLSDLRYQRDKIRLKIHLGNEDLKEEFGKLDDKLVEMQNRFEPLKDAVEESAEDVWDSFKLLGSEVKDGFQRIWKAL